MNNRNLYIAISNNKMSISLGKDKDNLVRKNELNVTNKSLNELKCIKRKKLYITVEGEKLYTTTIELPKLKMEAFNKCLINEIEYLIKNSDNVLFKYKILNKNSEGYKLIVYYVRCNPIKNIKDFVCKNKLKEITIVQTEIFNRIAGSIKDKEYGILFEKNKIVYMLYIKEGEIADNELLFLKDQQYLNENSQIEEFFNQCKLNSKGEFENIYSFNLNSIDINEKKKLGRDIKIIYKDDFIYA